MLSWVPNLHLAAKNLMSPCFGCLLAPESESPYSQYELSIQPQATAAVLIATLAVDCHIPVVRVLSTWIRLEN